MCVLTRKNRLHRLLKWGVALILLCCLTVTPAMAAESNLFDEARCFSSADATEISNAATAASERSGVRICVGTVSYFASDTDKQAYDFCSENRIAAPAVLLLYSALENTFELFPYGDGVAGAITTNESDAIIDKLIPIKQSGSTKDVAVAFCTFAADAYLSEDFGNEPPTGGRLVRNILIAVGVGLLGGGLACLLVVLAYRMRLPRTIYPLEKYARMDLIESDTVFLHKTVTHRVISSGNRSGGRGGRSGGSGRSRGRF